MNRGVLQSLPMQQMMAGSPNWWNINTNMRPPHDQINLLLPSSLSSSSSSSSSSSPSPSSIFPPPLPPNSLLMNHWHDTHELPDHSWSQLLMSRLVGEEDRCSFNHFQHKKTENWTDHVMYCTNGTMVDVKQESSDQGGYLRGHDQNSEEIQALKSQCGQVLPACSPRSCVTTTLSNNLLDFSSSKGEEMHQQQPDHSLECNSSQTGSAYKKARVRSTPQSAFKVRKENLGDRITALHQLVSPFGKTDTASVLLEAIGYIRFLQNQIEALSSPYLGSASTSGTKRQPIQAAERSSVFPEDPGQDACIKRRGGHDQKGSNESGEPRKDLRSRGLCLVPVACTMQVGSDNGADYWAPAPPAFGGGFH